MSVGQIIYNIEDYANSGGLISTNSSRTGLVYSVNQSDQSSNKDNYNATKIDITQNIVTGNSYTKVGIQAPSGTKVVLNEDKTILIGRTGIYELDEDISITSLYFIKPKVYIIDQEATDAALQKGSQDLATAKENRDNSLAIEEATLNAAKNVYSKAEDTYSSTIDSLNTQKKQGKITEAEYEAGVQAAKDTLSAAKATLTTAQNKYWQEYNKIQETYEAAYGPAWREFYSGISGVYKLASDEEQEAADLFNVIIDYIQE